MGRRESPPIGRGSRLKAAAPGSRTPPARSSRCSRPASQVWRTQTLSHGGEEDESPGDESRRQEGGRSGRWQVQLGRIDSIGESRSGSPIRPDGMAQMLSWLREGGATLVAFESSGGYERRLASFLRNSKMPYHAAHALRANFARAAGYEAKTDGIDARVLSEYGEKFDLSPDAPEDAETEALRDILSRRKQLVDQRSAERNRRDKGAVRDARASVERHIKWLDRAAGSAVSQGADPERRAVRQPGVVRERAGGGGTRRRWPPAGVGPFDGKRLTALVGLAPWSRDSGAKRATARFAAGRGRVCTWRRCRRRAGTPI